MKTPVFFILIIFVIHSSLHAQDVRSNTEGFNVGASGNYSYWSSSYFNQLDEAEPNGLGGGVRVGYGFNQRLEVFASFDGYSFRFNTPEEWDVYRLNSIGAGLRLNLGGTLQAFRPFVELGVCSQDFLIDPVFLNGDAYEFKMRGPAVMGSAGLNFFIIENLAINASIGGSYGKISSFLGNGVGFEDRPDMRTLRATVGLSFFFH